jgi:hypothetical protein
VSKHLLFGISLLVESSVYNSKVVYASDEYSVLSILLLYTELVTDIEKKLLGWGGIYQL